MRILAGDLSDFSFAPKSVDIAKQEFGRLDGLIINHGVIDPVQRLRDANMDEWKQLFDVNFLSAVAFVRIHMEVSSRLLRLPRPRLPCPFSTMPKVAFSSRRLVSPLAL